MEVESSVFGYLKKNKNIEVPILGYQKALIGGDEGN